MSKKIIIIDDDRDILSILSFIVQELGFEPVPSFTPQILDDVEAIDPALILLDIWLGAKSGAAVCRELKESEQTKKIPVVMISALPDGSDIAGDSGADGYIAKPFEVKTLERIIETMVIPS